MQIHRSAKGNIRSIGYVFRHVKKRHFSLPVAEVGLGLRFKADGSVARQSSAPPFGFIASAAVTGSSLFFRLALRSIPRWRNFLATTASADSCPKTDGRFRPPRRRLRKRLPPADAGQVSPDKVHELPPHKPGIYPALDQSDFARVVPARPRAEPCMPFLFVASRVLPPDFLQRGLAAPTQILA